MPGKIDEPMRDAFGNPMELPKPETKRSTSMPLSSARLTELERSAGGTLGSPLTLGESQEMARELLQLRAVGEAAAQYVYCSSRFEEDNRFQAMLRVTVDAWKVAR